jgi:NAD(P)-dependent dehydrogenase (short-subunit alcohol dehydrogenase family)
LRTSVVRVFHFPSFNISGRMVSQRKTNNGKRPTKRRRNSSPTRKRRAVLLCGPARATVAAIARELAGPELTLLVQAAPVEAAAADRLCRSLARRGAAQVVSAPLGGDAHALELVTRAWKLSRAIDAVVICPAAPSTARGGDPSLEAWREGVAAGLRAPFFVAKQAGVRMAKPGGRLIVAVSEPGRDGDPVAVVVHEGLLCMIEALRKALPRRVAVATVTSAGPPSAALAARIASGVRQFVDLERLATGATLDLGEAAHEG